MVHKTTTKKDRDINVAIITHDFSGYSGSQLVALEIANYHASCGHIVTIRAERNSDLLLPYLNEKVSIAREKIDISKYDIVWSMQGHFCLNINELAKLKKWKGKFISVHLSGSTPAETYDHYFSARFSNARVFNSQEAMDLLEHDLSVVGTSYNMKNAAPRKFHNYAPTSAYKIQNLLVVSNHLPLEVEHALKILSKQGINVNHIGVTGSYKLINPQDILDADAVLTIGKTAQYAFLGTRPVYCYDHFGGPGWINDDNFSIAEYTNFSGRCCQSKKTANQIVDELNLGFLNAKDFVEKNWLNFSTCYNLENFLEKTLSDINGNLFNTDECLKLIDLMRGAMTHVSWIWSDVFSKDINFKHSEALTARDLQIVDFNQALTARDHQIVDFNQALTARDLQIVDFNQALTARDLQIVDFNQALTARDEQINSLNQALTARDLQIVDFNQALTARDLQIVDFNQALTARDEQINSLNQALTARDHQIVDFNQALTARDLQIVGLTEAAIAWDLRTHSLDAELKEEREQLFALITSRSWRITKPLRFIGMFFRDHICLFLKWFRNSRWIKRALNNARRIKNVLSYIARGDLVNLRLRLSAHYRQLATIKISSNSENNTLHTFCIMTPKHTIFLAELISQRLQKHGWSTRVITEVPAEFSDKYYFVLCPHIFDKLPPGEKRIVYQLEQSVSSRWFTGEYFDTLNNSLAVLEYSLVNLSFLASNSIIYPHVNYLPIGATSSYGNHIVATHKKYDILFYGDSASSPRRRKLLEAAQSEFCVHIVNECFGDDMVNLIKHSRVVLNLHYYDDALLEMPRIQECISLGVPVVSESAQDQFDYPEIDGAVVFFEQSSTIGMLRALRIALSSLDNNTLASANLSQERFSFMFDRFLVAMGFLSTKYAATMKLPLSPKCDTFGLSLPETINRRRLFDAHRPSDCVIFDGIRRNPGWIGCGLSYVALANHAKQSNFRSITVMEDDVILPTDYQDRLKAIQTYLDHHNWDIFVGVIASLHKDTRVLAVDKVDGYTYVTIDRMTSTVFNIYGKRSLDALSSWNPEDHNSECNTIDQFLGNQVSLRVVVTLPFFVGHNEEVYSSLWGFKNTQYRDMISSSEILLHKKVAQYIREKEEGLATGV